jgi:phosphatidylglycerol:prolipoprotein diacylglycerol transferase
MTPPVDPILVELGPFAVHWYGLLIVTGILLSAISASHLAKRAGKNPDHIWDMLLVVIVLALIGARAYHVFSQPEGGLIGWDYYKENPIEVLYVWNGGLGIIGGVLGGALGILLYPWRHNLSPIRWLDFVAASVALGQSIGRWGNYVNIELYGPPTDLPWGLIIPAQHRIMPYTDLATYPPDTLFHPTFLYESLATLALYLVLFTLGAKRYEQLKQGDLLVGYLIGYAIIRFFTEMLRPDAWEMGGLAAAQVFSLVFIGAGVLFFAARHWLKDKTPAT